jgi:3-deoxy-D-manno-octulosonic-acid transferase
VIDVPSVLRAAGMPEDALVLLGSSTHEGEEAILADAFRRLRRKHPSLYLVLVPRHFERSRTVGSQLDRRRVRFVYRSEVTPSTPHPPGSIDCLVVNSTGELRHFYPHASVVFIGKSLVGRGGQTPIEAAAAGRALLFGPNMQNFPDIAPRFLAADGAVQVADKEQLETELDRLFSDPKRREELGRNAHAVVEANRGALEKTVAMIVDILAERGVVTE